MPVGTTIASFTILRRLGAGGMGEVFLAEDSRLSRKVALKFLTPEFAGDAERMRRFMQEAKAASALNHPNIVTVYEVGEGAPAFIATEYIDGITLRARMARPIPLPEALDLATQLVSAIVVAHQAGIIHRDIKPENVMVRPDGYLKVLDFGLAKFSSAPEDEEAATQMLTLPGMMLGTLRYMSPEQARGLPVDARTDIFAIGVLIFEMISGKSAFGGATSGDRLAAVLTSDPPDLSTLVPGIPPSLDALVRKTLQKNRDERYLSANDLLSDLNRVKASVASALTPPRHRRSAGWIVAAVVVGLFGLVSVRQGWLERPPLESASPVAAPAPVAPIALSYGITVQKYRDGRPFQDPFRLAQPINFEKDYRIRLHVTVARAGFLYLVSEAPPDTPGGTLYNLIAATRVDAGQETQVPEKSWFQFDAEQGVDRLWIVWGGRPVPELDSSTAFMNPSDKGAIRDAAISRRVAAFLTARALSQPVIETDDRALQTRIRTAGDPFVYLVTLEHH